MDRFTDQEFLYRQVPVNYDGIARINSIKGNTVSFNQLVENNNMHIQDTTAYAWKTIGSWLGSLIINHKYFVTFKGTTVASGMIGLRDIDEGIVYRPETGYSFIYTATKSTNGTTFIQGNWAEGTTDAYLNVFDLTLMGLDTLTLAQVREWFATYYPLPYYDYGYRLISFNGTGLKTVGFNQWDEEYRTDGFYNASGVWESGNYLSAKNYIPVIPNTNYYVKSPSGIGLAVTFWDADKSFISRTSGRQNTILEIPANCHYIMFNMAGAYGTTYNNDICINISDASKNGTYEPYTSNTLSLPTSAYFPTGMKDCSVSSLVYDELSDKAYTRVGRSDLGSLNWVYVSQYGWFQTTSLNGLAKAYDNNTVSNLKCALYKAYSPNTLEDGGAMFFISGTTTYLRIKDSKYTDKTSFQNAMSGVYLYYEMETPTSTDISLDLTYPIWNGGTEQILPVNGSVPTTAPIKVDIDYATGIVEVVTHPEPTQGGQTSGDGWYLVGEEATVVGTPSEHYVFDSWELDGETVSTDPSYTFEVTNE